MNTPELVKEHEFYRWGWSDGLVRGTWIGFAIGLGSAVVITLISIATHQ